MGFVRDDELICGVIFNNAVYHHGRLIDVEITAAAKTAAWITKGNLRVVFGLVFENWKAARLSACIKKSNKRARKFVTALGFVEEGVKKRGWLGKDDLVIYGMLKKDCRWIK